MVGPVSRKPYVDKAKEKILEKLNEVEVAYDRELRYRLEGEFAHDITWRALTELKNENEVKEFRLPGRKKRRRGGGYPNVFYTLPDLWSEKRRDLEKKARSKRELVALGVAAMSEAGRYAEELFWEGLKSLAGEEGWEVFPEKVEDVGKDIPKKILIQKEDWMKEALKKGPKTVKKTVIIGSRGVEGWRRLVQEGSDFDMALRVGEGDIFGVEIKNGLAYPKLYGKILAISKMAMLPLLVVRWLSLGQMRALPGPERGTPYGGCHLPGSHLSPNL